MKPEVIKEVDARLYALRDEAHQSFVAKLVPNINAALVLGIRTPAMQSLVKALEKEGKAEAYLEGLPHHYLEAYMLHGTIVCRLKNFDRVIQELDRLLPYIDNWMTCDLLSPKLFVKHREELLPHIDRYLASGADYTIRFGIKMLMTFYLDEAFSPIYNDKVAAVRSSEYYVNMMSAWYFATALAKQYEATIPYLQHPALDKWTHNKAIQKAIESRRITDEQKQYLRTLKVK